MFLFCVCPVRSSLDSVLRPCFRRPKRVLLRPKGVFQRPHRTRPDEGADSNERCCTAADRFDGPRVHLDPTWSTTRTKKRGTTLRLYIPYFEGMYSPVPVTPMWALVVAPRQMYKCPNPQNTGSLGWNDHSKPCSLPPPTPGNGDVTAPPHRTHPNTTRNSSTAAVGTTGGRHGPRSATGVPSSDKESSEGRPSVFPINDTTGERRTSCDDRGVHYGVTLGSICFYWVLGPVGLTSGCGDWSRSSRLTRRDEFAR